MTHKVSAEAFAEAIETFLPNDFRITEEMMAWDMESLEDLAFAIARFEEGLASAENGLEHTWAERQIAGQADPREVAHLKAKRTRLKQRIGQLRRMEKHLVSQADLARQQASPGKKLAKLANVIINNAKERHFRNLAREELDRDTFMLLARKSDEMAEAEFDKIGMTAETAAAFLEAYAQHLRGEDQMSEAA